MKKECCSCVSFYSPSNETPCCWCRDYSHWIYEGRKDLKTVLRKAAAPSEDIARRYQEVVSVGVKHDEQKLRYDLVPPDAEAAMVEIFTRGALKYGDRNWEKGLEWSRLYSAAKRHLDSFWAGQDRDSEWNTLHLAHAACSILMLLAHQLRGSGVDDRVKELLPLKTVLEDVVVDRSSEKSS